MSSEPVWLDRTINRAAFHFVLCLSAKSFADLQIRLGYEVGKHNLFKWIGEGSRACVTTLINKHDSSQVVYSVNLNEEGMNSGIEVAAALAHEAVHIFQYHCKHIGESKPSSEFQAYAIENILTALMQDYMRQTNVK